MTKTYSFDLSSFESGKFVATRYPDSCAVGGDWVCRAKDDRDALRQARIAAEKEWSAPDARHWSDFEVEFVDSAKTA